LGNVSLLNELTDLELIELSKNGDHSAYAGIVRRYEAKIAATIHGMVGHCIEADDIGQDVFIRFYNALDKFRGESALGTYLTRIAINLSLNELRRRKRRRLLSLDQVSVRRAHDPDTEPENVFDDRKALLRDAIEKLGPKYRSVLVLRLIDGYSTEETATILNIPAGTVLSRLARAQMKLKENLKPYLTEL
jgi:RNA polymerase sigma-70 factor (ECF subfamily)